MSKYAGETDALYINEQKNELFGRLRKLIASLPKGGPPPKWLVLNADDFELFAIHCAQYRIPLREGGAKVRGVPVVPEPGAKTLVVANDGEPEPTDAGT